jgi:hypothetical protein
MNRKRAFKWFRRVDGKLRSHNNAVRRSAIGIDYSAGGNILPKLEGSKIFVFESLDAAYDYISGPDDNEELWEVRVPEDSKPLQVRGDITYDTYFIKEFWKNKIAKKKPCGVPAPKGTLGASSISLSHRIHLYI